MFTPKERWEARGEASRGEMLHFGGTSGCGALHQRGNRSIFLGRRHDSEQVLKYNMIMLTRYYTRVECNRVYYKLTRNMFVLIQSHDT